MLKTAFLSTPAVVAADRDCSDNHDALNLFLNGGIGSSITTQVQNFCEKLPNKKFIHLQNICDDLEKEFFNSDKFCGNVATLDSLVHHLGVPVKTPLMSLLHTAFPVEMEWFCGGTMKTCGNVNKVLEMIDDPTYNAPINASGATNSTAVQCQISDSVQSLSNFPVIGSHNSGSMVPSNFTLLGDAADGVIWDQQMSVVGQLMHGARMIEINPLMRYNSTTNTSYLGNFTHENAGPTTTVENMLRSVNAVLNNESCPDDFVFLYLSEQWCEYSKIDSDDCNELAYEAVLSKSKEIFGEEQVIGSRTPFLNGPYKTAMLASLAGEKSHWRGKKYVVHHDDFNTAWTSSYNVSEVFHRGCTEDYYSFQSKPTRVSIHPLTAWMETKTWVKYNHFKKKDGTDIPIPDPFSPSGFSSYSDFVNKCDAHREEWQNNHTDEFVFPVIYSTNTIGFDQQRLYPGVDATPGGFPWNEKALKDRVTPFKDFKHNGTPLFPTTNLKYPTFNPHYYNGSIDGSRVLETAEDWISI